MPIAESKKAVFALQDVDKLVLNVEADRSPSGRSPVTLGAEGVLPGRQIESFLRVFKQFTLNLPRG